MTKLSLTPDSKYGLYLKHYVYQLGLDRSRALASGYFDSSSQSSSGHTRRADLV